MKNKRNNKFYIFFGILFFIAVLYKVAVDWVTQKFGVTIKEILYTVASPLKGADTDFLGEAVLYCLPKIIIFIVVWIIYSIIDSKLSSKISAKLLIKTRKKTIGFNFFKIFKSTLIIFFVIVFVTTSVKANNTFKVTEFVMSYIDKTTIYEDYYVNPNDVNIKSPEKMKNLIYIYLESMETTYASVEDGGKQESVNYIPNLTKIAKENITFSNSEKLGGFSSVSATNWTMAALLSTTSGVPFSFPVDGNDMDKRETFAKGLVTLGDILSNKGYKQMFLCGSNGEFGGRKNYFTTHGNYNVFDLYSAKDKGYIPNDYYVWWGYEDLHLYDIAKKELTNLAKQDEPFNFTMLTVDTHHIDGYICKNCDSVYENQLGNVLSCADSQIYNFLEWCKKQPFYDDTVIIVTGDHPRMDTSRVSGVPYFDRTIYNCFINTDKDVDKLQTNNRVFTSMDIFPTVLSALNFEIEGNKLGLGTNMFSGEKTLAENIGLENLQTEVNKYSKYYIDNFS